MVQAVNEANYKPKIIGGAMVGLQATVFKNKLGPKLNGIVNYETWVPIGEDDGAGRRILQKVPGARRREGVDPLGYYLGGWGYAYISLLGEAVKRRQEHRRRQDRRGLCARPPTRPSWATGVTARAANGPSPA